MGKQYRYENEARDEREAICTMAHDCWAGYVRADDGGDDDYIASVYSGGFLEAFVRFSTAERAREFITAYFDNEASHN
jgi:hypothetical protein